MSFLPARHLDLIHALVLRFHTSSLCFEQEQFRPTGNSPNYNTTARHTSSIKMLPTRALRIQPSQLLKMQSTQVLKMGPTRALMMQPTRALRMQPTQALKVRPTQALAVKPTRPLFRPTPVKIPIVISIELAADSY